MSHGSFRTYAFSRQSAFTLLVVVLAFACPPIVAATDDLETTLHMEALKTLHGLQSKHDPGGEIEATEGAWKLPRPAKPEEAQPLTRMQKGVAAFVSDPAVKKGIMTVIQGLKAADEATKSFKTLSPEEDQGPWLGAPTVPAGCVEPSAAALPLSPHAEECRACFIRAQAELDRVRRKFDRLQRIYMVGMGHMKALITFGESARNISPFANAATRDQAASLAADANHVRSSYDRSYDTLLQQLKTALDHIGECENRAFGNDWYNRYGFVLYQSFAMHYKRTD